MEYTKGEWKIEEDYTVVSDVFRYEGFLYKIAEVTSHTKEETLANAQLIAAAPEMYKTLKAIVAEGTRCLDAARPGREIYDIDKVDRMARQAIAKAEKGG